MEGGKRHIFHTQFADIYLNVTRISPLNVNNPKIATHKRSKCVTQLQQQRLSCLQ